MNRFQHFFASHFPALTSRDYAIFWVGQFLSVIGTWMQNTTLPYVAYQITGSSLDLGLIGFANTLPMLFVTLPAGVLVERWNKRFTVIAMQSVMMLQAFILAALTFQRTAADLAYRRTGLCAGNGQFHRDHRPASDVDRAGRTGSAAQCHRRANHGLQPGTRDRPDDRSRPFDLNNGSGLVFLSNGISYIFVVGGLFFVRTRYQVQREASQTKSLMSGIRRRPALYPSKPAGQSHHRDDGRGRFLWLSSAATDSRCGKRCAGAGN
jgi:hypothetical protein